ncbi:MAG: hypothetical protein ACI4JJ_04760 [Huintestinicola sp.]
MELSFIKDNLPLLLLVLMIALSLFSIVGGAVIEIKQRYFYGRRTKKYLSGEYESILHNKYPGWEFTLEKKNIRKKELRKLCASCQQKLSQLPLYSAGTLSKAFESCLVNVRIFVTVKPSYYQENERSADTYEETEYYTWLIFDVKPLYHDRFEMSGSFYAENFHPLPGAQDMINSLGQYMSNKGDRKYDMTATVCGGVKFDNGVNLSYLGIRRDKWQNAVRSGLLKIVEQLYSDGLSEMRLDYLKGKLALAAWTKMSDCEMYEGHNDFAIANSELISSSAEKLSEISKTIDEA